MALGYEVICVCWSFGSCATSPWAGQKAESPLETCARTPEWVPPMGLGGNLGAPAPGNAPSFNVMFLCGFICVFFKACLICLFFFFFSNPC